MIRYDYAVAKTPAEAADMEADGFTRYGSGPFGFSMRRPHGGPASPSPAPAAPPVPDVVVTGGAQHDESSAAPGDDDAPSIPSHAADAVVEAFGSLAATADASDDDVLAVDHVGPKTLDALRALHPKRA